MFIFKFAAKVCGFFYPVIDVSQEVIFAFYDWLKEIVLKG
ncbi:conserved hypothetical protein [Capnocytophaga canis]|uniref:Uncharacterized protein n=1 Tax=Capnocytophaga canis TaxID=1848903 RepID=A0A0B7IQR1_9FLAO|nr:conserved hypothetical protein [Capnocytophaga canis]